MNRPFNDRKEADDFLKDAKVSDLGGGIRSFPDMRDIPDPFHFLFYLENGNKKILCKMEMINE